VEHHREGPLVAEGAAHEDDPEAHRGPAQGQRRCRPRPRARAPLLRGALPAAHRGHQVGRGGRDERGEAAPAPRCPR
jgi:hypothetical protein